MGISHWFDDFSLFETVQFFLYLLSESHQYCTYSVELQLAVWIKLNMSFDILYCAQLIFENIYNPDQQVVYLVKQTQLENILPV